MFGSVVLWFFSLEMSTQGGSFGSGLGLGSGGEPAEGRTAKILSSCWIEEMEGFFRTSPYFIGAKVQFALDLLYRAARSCWELIVRSIMLFELETMS